VKFREKNFKLISRIEFLQLFKALIEYFRAKKNWKASGCKKEKKANIQLYPSPLCWYSRPSVARFRLHLKLQRNISKNECVCSAGTGSTRKWRIGDLSISSDNIRVLNEGVVQFCYRCDKVVVAVSTSAPFKFDFFLRM
jgi:hypothetical protein